MLILPTGSRVQGFSWRWIVRSRERIPSPSLACEFVAATRMFSFRCSYGLDVAAAAAEVLMPTLRVLRGVARREGH